MTFVRPLKNQDVRPRNGSERPKNRRNGTSLKLLSDPLTRISQGVLLSNRYPIERSDYSMWVYAAGQWKWPRGLARNRRFVTPFSLPNPYINLIKPVPPVSV